MKIKQYKRDFGSLFRPKGNKYCSKRHELRFLHFSNLNVRINELFCLFGVLRPTREFFTHKETSPLPVNGLLFYSALAAIEQQGFINVPHLLRYGPSRSPRGINNTYCQLELSLLGLTWCE